MNFEQGDDERRKPGFARTMLSDEAIEMVASRFRCLSEPVRLRILNYLERGEATVGQIVEHLGASQANVSKHLKTLVDAGILHRRPQGTSAYYSIADPLVLKLCETVCGALAEKLKSQAEGFGLKLSP